jgi:hypothetical protein
MATPGAGRSVRRRCVWAAKRSDSPRSHCPTVGGPSQSALPPSVSSRSPGDARESPLRAASADPRFVQLTAPLAWTTLSLTLRADGTQDFELAGASPFPRHWVYDRDGRLAAKSATIDYQRWSTEAFGRHTPWGDTDSSVFVSDVGSAVERELSTHIMRSGARREIRRLRAGDQLTRQGETADKLFLLLDGVLRVDVDGNALVEIGPGAVLGERAVLQTGRRTASLTAVTPCTVAIAGCGSVDMASLERIAEGHCRPTHERVA